MKTLTTIAFGFALGMWIFKNAAGPLCERIALALRVGAKGGSMDWQPIETALQFRACPYCLDDVPTDAPSTVCGKPECQNKKAEAEKLIEKYRQEPPASAKEGKEPEK